MPRRKPGSEIKRAGAVGPGGCSPLDGRVTLRVREVVKLTGFCQSTIYEMMDGGSLPNTKVRGIRLIYADGLRGLLGLTSATP